ncbi:hypothetical protein ACQWTT_001346 [Acinetobacter baumannii]
MIYQLTHNYTLLTDFFGIETNLDQNELEKVLFYIEAIHMKHMPNLSYIIDDTLSETDVIELLPILYKGTNYSFNPVYKKPEQDFITIDLWNIENSFQKYKPILNEINEKFALPNASLSLMKYYQLEVIALLKKENIIDNEENTKNFNREAEILEKILKGVEILPEWEITSFLQKDLTGKQFTPSIEKELL